MKEITLEEIEQIQWILCEACKGDPYMLETKCYKSCSGFKEELDLVRESNKEEIEAFQCPAYSSELRRLWECPKCGYRAKSH